MQELRIPSMVAPADPVEEEKVVQGGYCRIRDI
jgi:hypothetical protein